MLDIHANKIIANKFVGEFESNNDGFNIGDIKWSATDLTQVGFLIANGASVRRDTYQDLFNAIGTRWGSVDEEHFNLPNLIGKFAEGASEAGGYNEAGLPNITGEVSFGSNSTYLCAVRLGGAFTCAKVGSGRYIEPTGATSNTHLVQFNASRSNSIYGNSDTVQPNSALLTPYIKAFNGASTNSTDLEITQLANELNEFKLANDYVVETYSDENDNWYRKYKSGWVEQGGGAILAVNYNTPITLLVPMSNFNYFISAITTCADNQARFPMIYEKTSTSFKLGIGGYNSGYNLTHRLDSYIVCGMGAEYKTL